MRALTHSTYPFLIDFVKGSNEVLAREGIDTLHTLQPSLCRILRSNEVLAREGIDTRMKHSAIKTISLVAMRY